MRPARRAAVLLVLPLLSGCIYRKTVFHPGASATGVPVHTFTVIRSIVYFPMVGHEWDLNLSIPSERVRAGEEVRVPGPGVTASWMEAAEARRITAAPVGHIRIRRVRPDRVQADVDLRNEGRSGWRLRRTMWFRYQAPAAETP
jgi:hypothetical protein